MGVYWWCEMVVGWQICRWRGEWHVVGGDVIYRRGCCRELSWVLVAIGMPNLLSREDCVPCGGCFDDEQCIMLIAAAVC